MQVFFTINPEYLCFNILDKPYELKMYDVCTELKNKPIEIKKKHFSSNEYNKHSTTTAAT